MNITVLAVSAAIVLVAGVLVMISKKEESDVDFRQKKPKKHDEPVKIEKDLDGYDIGFVEEIPEPEEPEDDFEEEKNSYEHDDESESLEEDEDTNETDSRYDASADLVLGAFGAFMKITIIGALMWGIIYLVSQNIDLINTKIQSLESYTVDKTLEGTSPVVDYAVEDGSYVFYTEDESFFITETDDSSSKYEVVCSESDEFIAERYKVVSHYTDYTDKDHADKVVEKRYEYVIKAPEEVYDAFKAAGSQT